MKKPKSYWQVSLPFIVAFGACLLLLVLFNDFGVVLLGTGAVWYLTYKTVDSI